MTKDFGSSLLREVIEEAQEKAERSLNWSVSDLENMVLGHTATETIVFIGIYSKQGLNTILLGIA